jgi:hypothetical protein
VLSLHSYERPLVFPTALLRDSTSSASFSPQWFLDQIASTGRALVPDGFDLLLVGRNLVRFTIFLAPMLTLLSAAGLVLALHRRDVRLAQLVPFGALGVYYILFVGSVDTTYLATGWEPSFEASLVRYWLLLYVAMYFGAVYFLLHLPSALTSAWPRLSPRIASAAPAVLTFILVASTVPTVWWSWSGSLADLQDARSRAETLRENVVAATGPDVVVYANGDLHKFFAADRDVVVLPSAADNTDPDWAAKLAAHIVAVKSYRRVYVIDRGENLPASQRLPDATALDAALDERGVHLIPAGKPFVFEVCALRYTARLVEC